MTDIDGSPLFGLILGTLVWGLLAMLLIAIFGGVPDTLLQGGAATYVNQIWSAWMTIGVLLFAADGIVLLSFLTGGR
jgi:hypothetical protein